MNELFLFQNGSSYFPMTPGLENVLYDGKVYLPTVIDRDGITHSTNHNKSTLSIKVDMQNPFAIYLLGRTTRNLTYVTVFKDEGAGYYMYWYGTVTKPKLTSESKSITIECSSDITSLKHLGIRDRVFMHCRYNVYSAQCTLVKELNAFTFPLVNVTGPSVVLGTLTQPDDFFTNGIAEIQGQNRTVIKQTGTLVRFDAPFIGNITDTLTMYPGCDFTELSCKNKFNVNNLNNYGGFSRLPLTFPFKVNGVF